MKSFQFIEKTYPKVKKSNENTDFIVIVLYDMSINCNCFHLRQCVVRADYFDCDNI